MVIHVGNNRQHARRGILGYHISESIPAFSLGPQLAPKALALFTRLLLAILY